MKTARIPNAFYIGLQKTGSTYLRNYFYCHPEVHCSRNGVFFQSDEADVEASGIDTVRERYAALFHDAHHKPCHVDMYEALGMGYILHGLSNWNAELFIAPGLPLNIDQIYSAPRTVAQRLKAMVPEAKIIITIRNQITWMSSNYRHFFEQLPRDKKTLQDFLSTPEGKLALDAGMFDRIVDIYDSLFGSDHVHVIAMESLERDETRTLEDLCRFLDIRPVPYPDDRKERNRGRELSALLGANQSRAMGGLFSRLRVTSRRAFSDASDQCIRQCLSSVYAASNARLSTRLGLNLTKLGYPC